MGKSIRFLILVYEHVYFDHGRPSEDHIINYTLRLVIYLSIISLEAYTCDTNLGIVVVYDFLCLSILLDCFIFRFHYIVELFRFGLTRLDGLDECNQIWILGHDTINLTTSIYGCRLMFFKEFLYLKSWQLLQKIG